MEGVGCLRGKGECEKGEVGREEMGNWTWWSKETKKEVGESKKQYKEKQSEKGKGQEIILQLIMLMNLRKK